jgi:DNA-binding PadR family transcriptional regulator
MRKSGPPKGLVSYLVLELLDEQPRYGYEILKEIKSISGGHWEPSYGSVYPILYKFEEKGFAERIEVEDEPDRKYFEITDDGEAELAEKREEVGTTGEDLFDVILGFYHVFAVLSTDERFAVENPEEGEGWRFEADFSSWIVEQVIRHHEHYFDEFERVPDTPEEFSERMGLGDEE